MDENKEKTNEEQTPTPETPETAAPDNDEGDNNQSTSILDRVVKENERMEANIKRQEDIIRRQEEVAAKQILGGRAEAGGQPVKKTEDEKWAEDAKKRYEGSGLDPTSDNSPTTYI